MISMAILLVLIGIVVLAGSRALRAANESSASQTMQSLHDAEETFAHEWQGFSPLATNLAGAEVAGTTAASFTADEEVPTATANLLDAGYTNANYKFVYKASASTFKDSAGNTVASDFEFTGIPVNATGGLKAYCASSTGIWFNVLGSTATAATGAGCATDGYTQQ